jgi:hypothetical protein
MISIRAGSVWRRSPGARGQMSVSPRFIRLLLAVLPGLVLAACDPSRDRPTGLDEPFAAAVTVRVTEPVRDAVIPSDSPQVVVVEAQGSVQAVGYTVVLLNSTDTIAQTLREFDETLEIVEVTFGLQVPNLQTGEHLEFRGVAEGAAGRRFLSEPVFAIVIECDLFPQACLVDRPVGRPVPGGGSGPEPR